MYKSEKQWYICFISIWGKPQNSDPRNQISEKNVETFHVQG